MLRFLFIEQDKKRKLKWGSRFMTAIGNKFLGRVEVWDPEAEIMPEMSKTYYRLKHERKIAKDKLDQWMVSGIRATQLREEQRPEFAKAAWLVGAAVSMSLCLVVAGIVTGKSKFKEEIATYKENSKVEECREIAKNMPPREQWTTKELTIERECELALYEQKQRDAKEQQDEQSTGGDQ